MKFWVRYWEYVVGTNINPEWFMVVLDIGFHSVPTQRWNGAESDWAVADVPLDTKWRRSAR